MAQCKGLILTSRLRYVHEVHGEEASQRLTRELAPETQALLERRVLPHEWVPFSAFIDVNVVADRMHGRGDLALCREMGAWAATTTLPRVFRFFYRFGSPMFLLERASKLWGAHYDSGRMETHRDDEGSVHLRIHEFGMPHRAHCLSVLGWFTRSIEMSGAKVNSSVEKRCRLKGDECCELVANWT
ncbi:MAG: hypothetical protein Q8N23_13875 [Archangium sp.]|nr:hypothetical protein [Archangium sp.]MDP3153762.1 hypothetical protein [Archangium sp.]MDP3575679.1 hypothetical protein [Archangium sp.]